MRWQESIQTWFPSCESCVDWRDTDLTHSRTIQETKAQQPQRKYPSSTRLPSTSSRSELQERRSGLSFIHTMQPATNVNTASQSRRARTPHAAKGRTHRHAMAIHAGDIWHVNFGGRVGERYALVLCAPNFARADVMVCPLTTQLKPHAPSRVRLDAPCTATSTESEIKCEEIHTVPQGSMHRRMGQCPAATFAQAQQVLARILFGQPRPAMS